MKRDFLSSTLMTLQLLRLRYDVVRGVQRVEAYLLLLSFLLSRHRLRS